VAAGWRPGPDHGALAEGKDAAVQMIDSSGSLPASREHGERSAERNRKDPICFSPYIHIARGT
jgi:hypothetical protein